MRQLPEQCASCGRQIATLESCVVPDGTEKRGVEVAIKRAKSAVEMREPASKPERTPWAEKAKDEAKEGNTEGGKE